MYQLFKLKNKILIFFTLLLLGVGDIAYAINYEGTTDNPGPTDFLVPFARLFNLMLMVAGGALIIMLLYGAIKLSMALGKPMEFQGAQKTFTYAIVGFGIVAGFFAIWLIITNALGISSFSSPSAIFESMRSTINEFLEAGQVLN